MKRFFKRFRLLGELTTEWLIVPTLSIEKNGEPYLNPCIVLSLKWLHLSGGIAFFYNRDFNPVYAEYLGMY